MASSYASMANIWTMSRSSSISFDKGLWCACFLLGFWCVCHQQIASHTIAPFAITNWVVVVSSSTCIETPFSSCGCLSIRTFCYLKDRRWLLFHFLFDNRLERPSQIDVSPSPEVLPGLSFPLFGVQLYPLITTPRVVVSLVEPLESPGPPRGVARTSKTLLAESKKSS
jgi:hypothetical protein